MENTVMTQVAEHVRGTWLEISSQFFYKHKYELELNTDFTSFCKRNILTKNKLDGVVEEIGHENPVDDSSSGQRCQ